jgi:hypothetical protein
MVTTPTKKTMGMKQREIDFLRFLTAAAKQKKGRKGSRTRIGLDEVWTAFRKVSLRNPENEYEPLVLARQLDSLEEHGRIEQFRKRTRERVTLPLGIWLLPDTPPKPVPLMPVWHHELYWLAKEWPTATDRQRTAYLAVNAWFFTGPDLFRVPLRERALEIFGRSGSEEDFPMPEKTLDTLRSGPLFGDRERLHKVLRTFTVHPPLLAEDFVEKVGDGYYQRVGMGDVLLVVENVTTWWSLVNTLPDNHRLGYVAWGLGGTFRASINTISAKRDIGEVRYFGDLDLSGLRIPAAAADIARRQSLPPVRPTERLYAALLDMGVPRRGKEPPAEMSTAAELVNWLSAEHRTKSAALLVGGRRLAQEWVGYRHLSRDESWYSDVC